MVDGIQIATEIQDAQEAPSAVIDEPASWYTLTLRGTPHSCGGGPTAELTA